MLYRWRSRKKDTKTLKLIPFRHNDIICKINKVDMVLEPFGSFNEIKVEKVLNRLQKQLVLEAKNSITIIRKNKKFRFNILIKKSKKKVNLKFLIITFSILIVHCGTFKSVSKWPNSRCFVYSGVVYDYEGFTNTGPSTKSVGEAYARGVGGLIHLVDMPFSFVGDSIILPGTGIQCIIFRTSALEVAAKDRPFLHGHKLDDNDMDELSKMEYISDIFLDGSQVTDKGIMKLGKMTHLKRLSLEGLPITGKSFYKLKSLHNLYSLNLNRTKVSMNNLKQLAGLPKLTQLYLGSTEIKNPDLKLVSRFKGLRSLGLEKNIDICRWFSKSERADTPCIH